MSEKHFTAASADCVSIEDYRPGDSLQRRLEWLYQNRENFCDVEAVLKASFDAHNFEPDRIILNSSSKEITRTWAEILHLTRPFSLYGAYANVEVDIQERILGLRMINPLDFDGYCFSVALFQSIERFNEPRSINFSLKNILFGNDIYRAMVMEVFFTDGSRAVFDYSKEPKITEDHPEKIL